MFRAENLSLKVKAFLKIFSIKVMKVEELKKVLTDQREVLEEYLHEGKDYRENLPQ
jgi:hypothetical protein